jgi:hypothetical protein
MTLSIKDLISLTKKQFGIFTEFRDFIDANPLLKTRIDIKPTINTRDIPKWHQLFATNYKMKNIYMWEFDKREYRAIPKRVRLEEFKQIGFEHLIDDFQIDIEYIKGLSSSKSELSPFESLDKFVEINSPEMISNIDEDGLHKNLSHDKNVANDMVCYLWDGRIMLENNGGSHHFAAARYIASRLNKKIPVKGILRVHALREAIVRQLQEKYYMFAIGAVDIDIEMYTNKSFNGFTAMMKSYEATYFYINLPNQSNNTKLLFLPKDNKASVKTANLLADKDFFNMNDYFDDILSRQNINIQYFHYYGIFDILIQ